MDTTKQKQTWSIWYIVAGILGALLLHQIWNTARQTEAISYSEFEQLVAAKKISEVVVGSDTIEGTLKEPAADGKSKVVTARVDPAIADKLAAEGIKVTGVPPTGFIGTILAWTIPAIIFYFLAGFLFQRFAGKQGLGGLMTVGKSRAKVYVETDTKVTFKDVAGVDEAKLELQEIVAFLKNPKSFGRLGARAPKGILLVGPPGTGKTLLARAVAGEAGVAFFSISGSEFVEMFVGVGASRVRDLFAKAKKNAPCIIFIDEIDAVGRQRGTGMGGSHDEREQTLNQILVEMDGFETDTNVIVMAATNRPDVLDPALQRPGRFDRKVVLDMPDIQDREAILKVHAKNKPLAKNVRLGTIARQTPGFSGADLQNILNEAAILAARENKKEIFQNDVEAAVEKVYLGPERKGAIMNEHEKKITAYHESGHALVGHLLENTDPIHKISIISRGMSLGVTWSLPEEDKKMMTQAELEDEIAMLLAGRAAEKRFFKTVTTGASNDMEKATKLAREMVTRYGMSEKLGHRVYGRRDELVFLGRELGEHDKDYSEKIAADIDSEVDRLIEEGYKKAEKLISKHAAKLEEIAAELLKKENLDAADFKKLMGSTKA